MSAISNDISNDLSKDIQDILNCKICHNVLQDAVRVDFSCSCENIVCKDCARDYLQLNIFPKNSRDESKRCLTCDARLQPRKCNAKVYTSMITINKMIEALKKEDLECRRCGYKANTSYGFRDHKNCRGKYPCPEATIQCSYDGCHFMAQHKDMNEHVVECSFRPKCKICGQLSPEKDECHELKCIYNIRVFYPENNEDMSSINDTFNGRVNGFMSYLTRNCKTENQKEIVNKSIVEIILSGSE